MKRKILLLIIFFNSLLGFSQRSGELTYNTTKRTLPTYNLKDMLEMQNGVKKIANNYKEVIPYLETELSPSKCKPLLGKRCILYKKEISRMKTEFLKLEYSNEYYENRSYVLSAVKKMEKIDFELQQSSILKNKIKEQKVTIQDIEKNINSEKCESLKRRCKKIKKTISKIKKRQEYFIKKSNYIMFSDEIAEFEITLEEIIYELE